MTILAQPIHDLYCCCCGGRHEGRQFHNQDIGHGLCESCVDYCSARVEDMARTYGIRGYHFDLEFKPTIGTPEWAAIWQATYGRENLDAVTLRNLDAMKGGGA
jgi:hypothetical protein